MCDLALRVIAFEGSDAADLTADSLSLFQCLWPCACALVWVAVGCWVSLGVCGRVGMWGVGATPLLTLSVAGLISRSCCWTHGSLRELRV